MDPAVLRSNSAGDWARARAAIADKAKFLPAFAVASSRCGNFLHPGTPFANDGPRAASAEHSRPFDRMEALECTDAGLE